MAEQLVAKSSCNMAGIHFRKLINYHSLQMKQEPKILTNQILGQIFFSNQAKIFL